MTLDNMTLDNVYISIHQTIEEYKSNNLYIPSSYSFIHIIMDRINDKTDILEKNIIEFYDMNKICIDNLTILINNAFNYLKKRKVTNIIYYQIISGEETLKKFLIFLIQFKYYNTNFIEGVFNLEEKNNYIIFIDKYNFYDIYKYVTELKLKDNKIILIYVYPNTNYIDNIISSEKLIILNNFDINMELLSKIHNKIENIFGIYQNT